MAVEGADDVDRAEWVPVTEALRAEPAFDHGEILRDALRLVA
ncbi:hypothetical protein [Saccharopolyspora taberi]